MKLEVPIKVDIDDVTELIHDLQCLQTYKLGVNETTVLVSLDAVVDVFKDHIKAKRLGKDIDVPSKWNPVTEELPKEKGEYLVTYHPCYWDNVRDVKCVGIDTFRGKASWAKNKYQRVIAWMKKPDPWEGE